MKLNLKQTQAIDYLEDDVITELLFGGGAGGGKSFLGCYWQIKTRLRYPETRGLIGRAKLKTLKDTTLKSFFEVCKMQGLTADVHYRFNQQQNIIYFKNGSEILLRDLFYYPSDPEFDELGSLEITDAFIDEANQITSKAKTIVRSRIRYKLQENGLIPKMLLTCNPAKNWTYREFYKPYTTGTLLNDRAFIQALISDNKDIDPSYYNNLMQLDENSRQRLLFGNWDYDDNPDALINYDNILALFENNHISEGEDKYLIADIARYGSDRAIITVWYGMVMVDYVTFQTSSTNELVNCINAMRSKHGIMAHNCLADEDGVGGGVVDMCGIKGFTANAKPTNNRYASFKNECGYKLAEEITNMYIACDMPQAERDMICQELGVLMTYQVDKDMKLRILPKEKIKERIGRSPDWMDCFIMRMSYLLLRQGSRAIIL